jgi:hypothetical protein
MVGHDDPRQQAAPVVVIVEQDVFHLLRDGGDGQFAGAMAPVKVFFQVNAPLALLFEAENRFPFMPPFLGHGVGKAEVDHLDDARHIEVGSDLSKLAQSQFPQFG